VSVLAVQVVVAVSRNRTSEYVPTGKFEGTADGVSVEVEEAEGKSVAVAVVALERVSLPAGVEAPVVAVGELLVYVSMPDPSRKTIQCWHTSSCPSSSVQAPDQRPELL
jgi:hypothetical protein